MSDDEPQVKVLPVPEGSIVWLHNVEPLPPTDDGEEWDLAKELHRSLGHQIGHDRYVVLSTNGPGIVDVLGPDDLVARVRAALDPEKRSAYDWQYEAGFMILNYEAWTRAGISAVEPITRERFYELAERSEKQSAPVMACSVASPHEAHTWTPESVPLGEWRFRRCEGVS